MRNGYTLKIANRTFATRTIDKLPAVNAAPATPAPKRAAPAPGDGASVSVPFPLDQAAPAPVRRAGALRVAGLGTAVDVCAALGYFATVAARGPLSRNTKAMVWPAPNSIRSPSFRTQTSMTWPFTVVV